MRKTLKKGIEEEEEGEKQDDDDDVFELVYNFMLQLLMHISVYCHYHVQILIPSACVRPVKIVVSVCGFTIFLLADIYHDFLAVFRP